MSDLDCWRLRLLLPNSSYKPAKTYAMTEVPQCAEQQQQPVSPGCAGEAHDVLMEGLFWWVSSSSMVMCSSWSVRCMQHALQLVFLPVLSQPIHVLLGCLHCTCVRCATQELLQCGRRRSGSLQLPPPA